MSQAPYPPVWSRSDSPEILRAWRKFNRNTWIRIRLFFRDDDRQAAWRITALAGVLTFILVLLLFLEALEQESAVAQVQQEVLPAPVKTKPEERDPDVDTAVVLEPGLVDVSYAVELMPSLEVAPVVESRPLTPWPPVEQVSESQPVTAPPKPFVDPFETFAPEPEEEMPAQQSEPIMLSPEDSFVPQPTPEPVKPTPEPVNPFSQFEQSAVPVMEPRPVPVSEPTPEQLPIVAEFYQPPPSPELEMFLSATDLAPDYQYSDEKQTFSAVSAFLGDDSRILQAQTPWQTGGPTSVEMSLLDKPISWFEKHPAGTEVWVDGPTSHDSLPKNSPRGGEICEGDVVLTKQLPEGMTAHAEMTYTLKVKNSGKKSIAQVNVLEFVAEQKSVVKVVPEAQRQGDWLCWSLKNLAPQEERELQITCRPETNLTVFKTESRLEVLHSLAAATEVIIPDVTVSITLPVEVPAGEEFPLEIVVSNNSDRTFNPSDLRLQMLKGMAQGKETDLIRTIEIPAPGQSLSIPMTLTSTEIGEGILEAKLNLEETLTVPVTAYTVVSNGAAPSKPRSLESTEPLDDFEAPKATVKRHTQRVAVTER